MKYIIGMGVDWAAKLLSSMGWKCVIANENDKIVILYKRNGKIKDIRVLSPNNEKQ